ncbi:unnamed protein product [Phyllotreta striolata]|uniref:Glucose-methanol-choline oxidoreductase N-terminal domain-containing protein n=1 Tax=Phyllotreta striolata TaxID=444603 RepID=A0A9N9XN10_PHYSR|nr:unnamed protein product [Phyllotreta striolata]
MFITRSLIILVLVTTCLGTEKNQQGSFDDLLNLVNENIQRSQQYVKPKNNSYMSQTEDDKLYDYGAFDFVIVGGGTAGSVMARRLSEIYKWSVLVLEAGDKENQFTDIPYMNVYTLNSEYNWGYQTVPQKNSCLGMVNKTCMFNTGKGLGGSGILGAMIYTRGNREDFDGWASSGLTSWSYQNVLPYFKKSERIQTPDYDEGFHGTQGPLCVNYTAPDSLTYGNFLESCKLAGLKNIDYNGRHQVGVSRAPMTIDFNKRLSGGSAFVLPVINTTSNLNVTLHAFVTKLRFSGNAVTGVEFVKDKKRYLVKAKKEVILSGGAVNTPQLLLLSGVGPKEDLEKLGIPVVKNLPVGQRLVDHPAFAALYIRTNVTTPMRSVPEYLKGWTEGQTPFTRVFDSDSIAFINTKKPGFEPADIELLTTTAPFSVPPGSTYNLNKIYSDSFLKYNTLTDFLVYVILVAPKSQGNIKLQSNKPEDFPLVNPQYFTDANGEDIEAVYEGIKFVHNLVEQPPLKSIGARVVTESPSCEHLKKSQLDKDYWYCTIQHISTPVYEPSGTTRMGLNPDDSVVNENLKVHGFDNLRVVDAGVMPSIVRGYMLGSVYMIAEKAADLIKEEYKMFLFGVYLAAPADLSDAKSARILKFDHDDSGKGSYRYGFQSSDGVTKEESGEIHYPGTKREFMKVTGVFSYPGPDGVMYEVRYTADDQGFHPEGDHIKVPPFVPWVHHDDDSSDTRDSETGRIDQVVLTTPKPTPEYLPTATTYLPSSPSSTPKPVYSAGESVLEAFGSGPSSCVVQPPQCAAPASKEGFGSTPVPTGIYLPSTGGPVEVGEVRGQSFLSTPSPNPEVQFNSTPPPQLRNFRAAAPAPQVGKPNQPMMMLFIGPMGPQFIPIMK